MLSGLICPGCRAELDTIAAIGRPDDLFLCSNCYHSWFRFELAEERPEGLSSASDEAGEENTLTAGELGDA